MHKKNKVKQDFMVHNTLKMCSFNIILYCHLCMTNMCLVNTVSLPDSPIATLGQGPLACSCDAQSPSAS